MLPILANALGVQVCGFGVPNAPWVRWVAKSHGGQGRRRTRAPYYLRAQVAEQTKYSGFLESLGAKAAAVTAILGLVFLVAPRLRPHDEPSPAPPTPPFEASEEASPSERSAIRSILTSDHEAGLAALKAESAAMPNDEAPRVLQTQAERVAWWSERQRRAHEVATVYQRLLSTMRSFHLSLTTQAFRESYQAHISAWQTKADAYNEWAALVDTATVNVQVYGDAAYMQTVVGFVEGGKAFTTKFNGADQLVTRTWDDVRRASLAAGIDAPE